MFPATFYKIRDYWLNPKDDKREKIKIGYLESHSLSKRLTVSAFLSTVAVTLQSAGVLGGVGFAASALAALPIAISAILSVYSGLMSYFMTILLLVIFQPSELIIFPFTTGLLGLSIGFSFRLLKRRITIVTFNALCLTIGITILLYVFKYPVLGPEVSGSFHIVTVFVIYAATLLYSWLWFKITLLILKAISPALKS